MWIAQWATNSRILELGKIMTKNDKLNKGFKVKNGIKKIISEKQYFYMTFKPRKHSFEVKNPVFILCDKFENTFFDKLLLDDYCLINEKYNEPQI